MIGARSPRRLVIRTAAATPATRRMKTPAPTPAHTHGEVPVTSFG